MRLGHARSNPFQHARILAEGDRGDIVHFDAKERDAVLKAADGLPDGVALWLALYAGLRRGEIAGCKWADVSLDRRKLVVPRSKTFRRRTIDLAAPLVKRLSKTPEARRRGRVVPWPAGDQAWKYRAGLLLRSVAGALTEGVGADKIAWNVFRHTFASLLVQGGVSIYKVASWMGNGVAICQRHYASMSPEFDSDIDRMV